MASIYCLMADKIWNIYQAVPVCCWYWRVEEMEIIHMNTMVDLQQVEKALYTMLKKPHADFFTPMISNIN